jgi:hypothetical protein
MIQKYTQSTHETCLACCLLQAVDRIQSIEISQKLELDCIIHSWSYSKADFVIGHLDFIAKKFNVKIRRIVDNKPFYNYVKKINSSPNIRTEVRKINLNLVNQLLDKKPILYIDAYYLFKVYHHPHFITVLDKIDNKYKIFDTWDGKEKLIESKILSKSISSLRNHIKLCPQMIIIY